VTAGAQERGGGRLFRQYAAEVERRLWSCPAYRVVAPAAATN